MCGCQSHDAYECWELRYPEDFIIPGDYQSVEIDGGPCQCYCHYDYGEEDE